MRVRKLPDGATQKDYVYTSFTVREVIQPDGVRIYTYIGKGQLDRKRKK
jgi:hypothetical protein